MPFAALNVALLLTKAALVVLTGTAFGAVWELADALRQSKLLGEEDA